MRVECLPVVRLDEIPSAETRPRWLIEGLWGASAVGIIGGAPKCCKSWLGLDVAVSVATGTPCLGRYRVLEAGPALIYLAEDALPVVRERIEGILRHRGLVLRGLEVHAITAAALRLDRETDRLGLFETARRLQPRLLLLDPLVRLHGIDENHSNEVAELLGYLRTLQRELSLSVVLVHHTRKNAPVGIQAGQGLRGSSDLHAFGDSNLYLRRTGERLVLTVEHRAAPAARPMYLELVASDDKQVHLEARGMASEGRGVSNLECLEDQVLALLAEKGVVTRGALREALEVKNERLGQVLIRLQEEGRVYRGPQGWALLA